MSAATKRKHVTNEQLNSFEVLPDPQKGQRVARIVAPKGNNLHQAEAQTSDGELEVFLVSMPNKFRKNVWIKRGDFVLISPIEEGDKVKGEIERVLYKDQIKYLKSQNLWPQVFQDKDLSQDIKTKLSVKEDKDHPSSEESEEDDDSDLFQNTNRPVIEVSESSSSEEDDE